MSVDGDGQRGRGARAISVRQGVHVAVRQRLSVVQAIHRRVGVVQCVGVLPVSAQRQAAVRQRQVAHRGDRRGIHVRSNGVGPNSRRAGQYVAGDAVRYCVFADAVRVIHRYRLAVGDGDVDGVRRAVVAQNVCHDDRDAVRDVSIEVLNLRVVGVAHHARRRVVPRHDQRAFYGVDRVRRSVGRVGQLSRGEARPADGDVVQPRRRTDGEAARRRTRRLRQCHFARRRSVGVRDRYRRVIRHQHIDRYRRGIASTVPVIN